MSVKLWKYLAVPVSNTWQLMGGQRRAETEIRNLGINYHGALWETLRCCFEPRVEKLTYANVIVRDGN